MENSQKTKPPKPLKLSRARAAAGMTQQQLADAADLHVRTITNIEAGQRFHKSTGRLLASALKLPKADAKRLTVG